MNCDAQECRFKGPIPFGVTLSTWVETSNGQKSVPLTITTRRLQVPPLRDVVVISDLPGRPGPGPDLPVVVRP